MIFKQVSLLEKIIAIKYLLLIIKAGLTLSAGFRILAREARGYFKEVVETILGRMEQGQSLANGLEKFPHVFSPIFLNLVKIGEKSGTLEKTLSYLAKHLEKTMALRKKIRGAMIYPIFVLIIAVGVGFSVAIFILPKLTRVFSSLDIELPASTKFLLYLARIFENYGLWIVLGVLILIGVLVWIGRQKFAKPFFHKLSLKLPLIGSISRNHNLAIFTRTLGILLKSGLPIKDSLKITSESTGNFVYRTYVKSLTSHIERGETLSSGLKDQFLFPRIATQIIDIGEKTGSLEESLLYLAEFYEREVGDATENLSTALEPILLIIIGGGVAFVALSIITPIYQITAGMGIK